MITLADSAADKQAVKKLQTGMILGGTGLAVLGVYILAVLRESLWGNLGMLPLLIGVIWVATVFHGRSLRKHGVGIQLLCLQNGLWYAIAATLKLVVVWSLLLLVIWALRWLSNLG